MNSKLKEHLISAGYTFTTAFVLSLLVSLQDISLQTLEMGAITGIVFAALRAGIKVLIPLIQSFANK